VCRISWAECQTIVTAFPTHVAPLARPELCFSATPRTMVLTHATVINCFCIHSSICFYFNSDYLQMLMFNFITVLCWSSDSYQLFQNLLQSTRPCDNNRCDVACLVKKVELPSVKSINLWRADVTSPSKTCLMISSCHCTFLTVTASHLRLACVLFQNICDLVLGHANSNVVRFLLRPHLLVVYYFSYFFYSYTVHYRLHRD
jgi:hypothetical protein